MAHNADFVIIFVISLLNFGTNSQVADEQRRYDTHVTSLEWPWLIWLCRFGQHFKGDARRGSGSWLCGITRCVPAFLIRFSRFVTYRLTFTCQIECVYFHSWALKPRDHQGRNGASSLWYNRIQLSPTVMWLYADWVDTIYVIIFITIVSCVTPGGYIRWPSHGRTRLAMLVKHLLIYLPFIAVTTGCVGVMKLLQNT